MKLTREVFSEILNEVPAVPPETGGILGEHNGVVCMVVFMEVEYNEAKGRR